MRKPILGFILILSAGALLAAQETAVPEAAPASPPMEASAPSVEASPPPSTADSLAPAAPELAPTASLPGEELILTVDTARVRIAELEEEIASLESAVSTKEEELALVQGQLEYALATGEAERAELEGQLQEEREARAEEAEVAERVQADLFAAADTASLERDAYAARIALLEAEREKLLKEPAADPARLAELEKANAALLAERDELAARLAALEAERDALASAIGFAEARVELSAFPELVLSGFGTAKPRIGRWKLEGKTALQLDGKEFFSRLEFPLEQGWRPYLYRFRASSEGKGWVGVGLHLFSSKVKSRRGYGEGRSLLVWLTRDPAVRKTDATWLQLYRSDNDVVMERVVDAKLEEAVSDTLLVEVLYDPRSGYLTVAVDGRLALKYRAFFGIEAGVGVSLRSLGAGARFSDFEVRAAP